MPWDNEPLEEHELHGLLRAASNMQPAVEFTVRLLASTGMRPSEAAHMDETWLADGEVVVPEHSPCACSDCRWKARQSSRHGIGDYWRPKNDAAARSIPVRSDEAARSLEEYFTDSSAVGVTRQTVKNRVEAAADEAGLEARVKPIVLRHTYGVRAAESGLSREAVRDVMGHSTLGAVDEYFEYADA